MIVEANRAEAQLLGVPARFLVHTPLALFIDEPDLRIFGWCVNNVQTRSPGEWPMRVRPRDGSPFTAGLTIAPFKAGNPRSDIRWFLRDITARQRAEQLAAAQEFTAQMLESEQAARAAAESARLSLELQAEVSRGLAESLDAREALTRVAGLRGQSGRSRDAPHHHRDVRPSREDSRHRPASDRGSTRGPPDVAMRGRSRRALQPRGKDVYLVALTGYGAPLDRDRVMRAGFDFYLVKPVDPKKLLDVIAQGPAALPRPSARAGHVAG